MSAIRKLAAEAADNGLLAPELAAGISRVKSAKTQGIRVGNWLSLRQAQALLSAPDTGARRGEVLALRWSDIQEGRAIITRSLTQTRQLLEFKGTKTERPRDVKVPESALAALDRHRKRQDELREQFGPDYRADLDLIFANPNGTPIRPNSISSVVSLLFRRLGLPKGASLHSLRHSHGSHLVADGVPLPVVSERLGHSSVRTTADVYTHALRGQDDDAARRWDDFQRRGTGDRVERKIQ